MNQWLLYHWSTWQPFSETWRSDQKAIFCLRQSVTRALAALTAPSSWTGSSELTHSLVQDLKSSWDLISGSLICKDSTQVSWLCLHSTVMNGCLASGTMFWACSWLSGWLECRKPYRRCSLESRHVCPVVFAVLLKLWDFRMKDDMENGWQKMTISVQVGWVVQTSTLGNETLCLL